MVKNNPLHSTYGMNMHCALHAYKESVFLIHTKKCKTRAKIVIFLNFSPKEAKKDQ